MKKAIQLIFSITLIMLISIGSVFAISAGVDPILDDSFLNSYENLNQLETGGNFITDNWGVILAAISILITVFLRLVPSNKNFDPLTLIVQIIDSILPNKAKIKDEKDGSFLKGIFKYRKEKKK